MTNNTALNVLDEALITIDRPNNARAPASLCAVLAALSRREEIEFAALQAHQQHGWYAFLVQLAATALQRAGIDSAKDHDESMWRAALLGLTDDRVEPWCLVVDDWTQPALLQPPMPRDRVGDLDKVLREPDALDVLITSKNFDVKATRMRAPSPEHWLFALVSLQTMSGYAGSTCYGVSRMNGGYGTRVGIGRAPSLALGPRFTRDVSMWLRERPRLLDSFGYSDTGRALLWLASWDGSGSIAHAELDPFYIEVCRRVRLRRDGPSLVALYRGVKAPRVEGFDGGLTGDLWAAATDDRIFTVKGQGFDYEVAQQLLLQADYRCAALEASDQDGQSPWFIARGLARGQCKTEGYHERMIPIPKRVAPKLKEKDQREFIARLATVRVKNARTVRSDVLYPALTRLLIGGRDPKKNKAKSKQAGEWTRAFTAEVDRIFFDELFDAVEQPPEEAAAQWQKRLLSLAWELLQRAINAVPLSASTRWRAICAAESTFDACANKQFNGVQWRD